jgi:hypothetical protein
MVQAHQEAQAADAWAGGMNDPMRFRQERLEHE